MAEVKTNSSEKAQTKVAKVKASKSERGAKGGSFKAG
jgi:hypothetical protein